MRLERCCVCDAETGRAGRADDSLYMEGGGGSELGPLCEDCHNAFRRDDLEAEVKRLRAVICDVFSWEPSHSQEPCGLDTIGNSLDPSDDSRLTIIATLQAAEAAKTQGAKL